MITAELSYLREENQIIYMNGISERSAEDANASMGVGATDSQARVLASCSPGEWGKLLGLDRSPATKTLRKKVEWL